MVFSALPLPIRASFAPPKGPFDWDTGEAAQITVPEANAFVYQSYEEGPSPAQGLLPITTSATGPTITAGGISIQLIYDSAALAAPSAFRAGIEAAALQLAKVITDKITVNIQIHYSGSGGGASAKPDDGQYIAYSTVRDDLINAASPGDPTFNALPTGSTIQGQSTVAVFNSQLKLFGINQGVTGPNDTTSDDGEATFATDIPSDDLIGVALHEISHALGRVPYGAPSATQPDIFDLFRFTQAGTRLFTSGIPAASAYFSIDGGNSKLADFGQNSDPSDFLNSGVQGASDPFNEFYDAGTSQTLSGVDLEMLDALGFHIVTAGGVSIGLKNDNGVSGSDHLTNDPTLSGAGAPNGTITLKENGVPIGTATVAASGVWSYKPSLADGSHTIVASQGSKTATLTFTLATKAPTLSATESVSGQTAQTSDTISVTAAAESVAGNSVVNVEIFDGGADLGAATLSGGAWSYTANNLLPGAHNFTARATDAAGNAASTSLATVTVTGAAPPPNAQYTLSGFGFTRSDTTVTDIRAKGVNDLGEVVGYYIDGRPDDIGADGNTYYEHGFYSTVSSGTRSYFGIDDPDAPLDSGDDTGIDRTRAFGVNNTGDIVGWYSQDEQGLSSAGTLYTLPDAGFIMAAQWPNTFGTLGFNALNDLGTHTLGINNNGDIVGYYNDGTGAEHGLFRAWTGYGNRGNYVSIDPKGAVNTIAEGINDSDLAVGYFQGADGSLHGFSYSVASQVFTPIDFNGATSTAVLGVNNIGEMVGYYIDTAGKRHGFIRSAAGQYATIDDANAGAGGTLVGGINNFGEIVGWYTAANGHDASFTGAPATPTLAVTSVSAGPTVSLSGVLDGWDVGLPVLLYDGATYLTSVDASIAGNWTASLSITAAGVHDLTAQTTNAAGTGVSQTLVDLVNASTTLTGGGQTALFGTSGDTVILTTTAGVWDTVYGANGTIMIANAQASVVGGGDTIKYGASIHNATSLYNTGGHWDAVYATSGAVTLVNAQASILGGDDAIYTDGAASDAASLYNTGGAWDAVYGANAQVYLTGAQASVVGGGDVVTIAPTSQTVSASSVSLYNTKGAWDAVYGSGDYVYLTGAQGSILGGGDAIYGFSGASISLYDTAQNWDAVYGAGEAVYLTGAQASILGGGDTIALASGATASLYNTAGSADAVSAVGQTLFLTSAQANLTGGSDQTYFFGTNDSLGVSGAGEGFHFQAQFGVDSISGFVASDVIHLAASDWTSFSALQSAGALTSDASNDAVIALGANKITLVGFAAGSLSAANFAFG
jgi:hypothetical protein